MSSIPRSKFSFKGRLTKGDLWFFPTTHVIFFAFLFLPAPGFSQQLFFGNIIDEASDKPIPYAHILIDGTNSGTVSNEQGRFKLVYATNNANELTVRVSCIGYKTTLAKLSAAQNNSIVLKAEEAVLQEVVVRAHDYARELVQKAVAGIAENYVNQPEMISGFVRNGAYQDAGNLVPYYLIEAVIEAEKGSYVEETESGHVKVEQARKYENEALDSLDVRFFGGQSVAHWGDLVSSRRGPLDVRRLDGYDYSIVDTLIYDGHELYQVKFSPGRKVAGTGMLYIQEASLAIVKIELQYDSEEVAGAFSGVEEALMGRRRLYGRYITEYAQTASAWRLSRVEYRTAFERGSKPDIFLTDYFVATNATPLKASIPYEERIAYRDIFLHETGPYDPNFWQNYTIVLPTEMEAAAFEKSSGTDANRNSKAERTMAVLSRLRMTLGVGLLPTMVNGVDVAFQQDAFGFQEQIMPASIYESALTGSMEFELTPNLIVGFASVSSFRAKRYTANWAKIGWESQFASIATRPFYVDASIQLGQVDHRYRFGTYPTDGIEVNGRKLNSEKIDAFVVQKAWSAMPSIRISGEKTKRLRFFVEVGRYFFLKTTDGLILQEKQFWFKKAAFVPTGATGFNFQKSTENAINNAWCFNAGMMISL
jgi:hypothetical protein